MTSATSSSISAVIRDLRKRKKLTVRQLAACIDRSIGFISQIERGLSQPTVQDLIAIATALKVPYEVFADPGRPPKQAWITYPGERRTLSYARGVTDSIISPNLSGNMIIMETILEPGADFGERSIVESSEQGGYVLEGELTIWIADEEIVICATGGFQIPGGIPCRCGNRGDTIARVLWIYS